MKISTTVQEIVDLQTDCLVLGVLEGEKKPEGALSQIDQKLEGQISSLLAEGDFLGKNKETLTLYTFGKLPSKRIMLVGLGKEPTFESVRGAAATAIRIGLNDKVDQLVFCLESYLIDTTQAQEMAHALGEGAALGGYRFKGYAWEEREYHQVDSVVIATSLSDQEAEVSRGAQIAEAFSAGTNLARDLVNTPGNKMTPAQIADAAVAVAQRYGMEYEVLEREDMEKLGMGGLLGVAQGSAQPPKLIAIKYKGAQNWDDVLGFVGKGISFDTGGISLKPGLKMEEMIGDMGGAAAVIGALEALGRLKPSVNVLAVIPSAENMPSGTALKPGDIITTMSGRTVEVLNTDAEGRLVLADGVSYAKKLGADYIVDVATLTGAVLVALGTCTTGVVTNDDDFVDEVLHAAADAGELVWQLPSFKPYKEQIKSRVADLKNTGGRNAGSITGGLFIGAFAEETPWVHLDIAGTSWADKQEELSPQGGTGAMTRTLAVLAMGRSANRTEE
ncbi:leucyl aminopeptidase [Ammoniphilus oxalaticus]|uniref:Probable cytosol aminopeptidase n=1 Tax=Ammoniphilus oxalaticus TaxID=66863 RepID=A0A419SEZ9_9BACL|nr:leucyl aminopeptidase [Ammoniphilus oxalaticus]RKD21710.1 leucyl aminopeptidase [Ammoniphilus oxalaticus]